MAYMNNVRDGREANIFLCSFAAVKAASCTEGHVYAITKKAASASGFGDLKVGELFVAVGTITLADGDECVEVTPKFIGGATDKELNREKTSNDVTCDKDESAVYISDGKVSVSGSISLYSLIQDPDSAANQIKQRFMDINTYGDDGKLKKYSKDRTEKDFLMFVWDARNLQEGEYAEVDFVAGLITSLGHQSSYGSPQSMPVSFNGNDSDDQGHRSSNMQFKVSDEFIQQIETWKSA